MIPITCEHWTAHGNHGTCALGKFGGRPSLGTCMIVCLGRPYTPPQEKPAPSWLDLRTTISRNWPDWTPEIDGAIITAAGCTPCEDAARRRRWSERIAALTAL